MNIYDLIRRANDLSGRHEVDSITPEDVGSLASDTLTYISMLEQNLQALGIRKTYASEADMNADTAPMGDNGMPIRFGQLVMVTATGKIYSYQAPGWKAVSDAALPVPMGNVVGKRGDRLGNVLGDIGVADPSVEGFTLDDYTTSGTYRIMGDRTNGNDGMPIANEGGGHRVDAVLTVLDASISSSEACVTQMLVLSNRVAGDGNMYMRTAKGTMPEIQSGANWETWQKMVGQWEKGMVADATELDTWTESGMYSAMMTSQSSTRGLTFNPGDTLFVITINGYDSERLSSTITAQCTQFLYRLPAYYGGVNTGVAKAEQYVGTGLWTGSRYSWGDWKRLADSDDVDQLSKNINSNTKGIEILQKEVAAKQQELTLTVLDNGNIRIGNLQGQTKDFMPATPSGDPMHYAYVEFGAVYNDTDKPISRLAPWKTEEFWEKNADGTYTYWEEDAYVQHLPGRWYLSGIGYLSNTDMRIILKNHTGVYSSAYYGTNSRVIKLKGLSTSYSVGGMCVAVFSSTMAEVIDMEYLYFFNADISGLFSSAKYLEFVIAKNIYLEKSTMRNIFKGTPKIKNINLTRLSNSLILDESPLIYKRSILYMINNSIPTTAITITLHPDAYVRIANQPDIIEALETKNAEVASTGGSISLVSA